jgi:hypothetical protein
MALTFTDLITPDGSGANASSYVTASLAPTANRLIIATIMAQAVTGTPSSPTLTGGGVSTWTSGAGALVGTRRLLTFRALTDASPTSGAVTIDLGGVTHETMAWQFVEIDGSLLTGTNGADAIVQSITHAASSGTNVDLELGTAWADAANRGLVSLFSGGTGHTFTMVGAGFTQLGIGSGSGRVITGFYGRDADDLTLGATVSNSSGAKLGIGLEIAAAPTEATDPPFTTYPRIRTYGLNRRLN